MSAGLQRSVLLLSLPDVEQLCFVSVTLQEDEEEQRSRQMKTCRELVLLHGDILASPALDSFTEIMVVMAVPVLQRGVLQLFGQRRRLQLGSPQCVSPGVLQCCLSFSLVTRLSPSWTKAGLYLISGPDFLTQHGWLDAVSMELSTCERQLCVTVEPSSVRLPPTTLQDFDLPLLELRRFCSDPDSVLDPSSCGGAVWCHVLPSMKKGQIITISRQLPRDGPFRTYRDLQDHWSRLYGYRLPELAEEDVVYCSVYFRPLGDRLFTYPLSCVRLQPLQRRPPAGLQGALGSFLSDVTLRLQSVCGLPARVSGKPRYHTVRLHTAATVQVVTGEHINVTTSSSSIRAVLSQFPPLPTPPPPPPPLRPVGSQPPPWAPLSQHDGAQGLLGNGCGGRSLTKSQSCREEWSSSSSSSSFSSSSSSIPLYQPTSSLTSSSSSSSSLVSFSDSCYQLPSPLSSSSFSSSSSSSLLPPPPPPSQAPVVPAPKLVPVFRIKSPSRRVKVALLQQEQLGGGGGARRRVTLPVFRRKTPPPPPPVPPLSSLLTPPLTAPRSGRRPRAPQSAVPPRLRFMSSLSPSPRSTPVVKHPRSAPAVLRPEPPPKPPPEPSRPGLERPAAPDLDVEEVVRSNQRSRLSGAALLAWLKERGASVRRS